MRDSFLLTVYGKILFPFMMLFSVYLIVNGDLSPGGGFQGGAILATAYLMTHFTRAKRRDPIALLLNLEKFLILNLIPLLAIGILTGAGPFKNPWPMDLSVEIRRSYYILLNFLIAMEVFIGLSAVLASFIKEESL